MTYRLVFGYSTSQDYRRAVRIVSALPDYSSTGAEREIRHSVALDGAAASLLEELVLLVGGWRSSLLLADDVAIGRPAALGPVLACQRVGARSGLGALHCCGLPAFERGRVPCRLLDRVLPWTLDGEYANAELLPQLLTAHARQLLLDACPAYDAAAVLAAALASRGRPRHASFEAMRGPMIEETAIDDEAELRRLLRGINLDPTDERDDD